MHPSWTAVDKTLLLECFRIVSIRPAQARQAASSACGQITRAETLTKQPLPHWLNMPRLYSLATDLSLTGLALSSDLSHSV